MRAPLAASLALLCCAATSLTAVASVGRAEDASDPIAAAVARHMSDGALPGAVVIVGHDGRVVYRRAFGYRLPPPQAVAMTADTIFDLASLTKPIATATAILQLVEAGELGLDEPVAKYWSGFAASGKQRITVRDLLTHSSGLRADLDLRRPWTGRETALKRVTAERPVSVPGHFRYSDIGFVVLGELVQRVSGLPLDEYCARRIFGPLGMTDTLFRPPDSWRARIAPTGRRGGTLLRGEVHDPTAARMGGVAGHAGLFSSADDLARFAQMLLDGGALAGRRILAPETVRLLGAPQPLADRSALRGLGWDIDSPYSARGDGFGPGSYGHTGFTGTSLWIDPASRTYVILLASSPDAPGRAQIRQLRSELATIAARTLARADPASTLPARADLPEATSAVRSGIDVLVDQGFAALRGLRVGLITNQSGIDSGGRRTIDLLRQARGVTLVALFSPEHGLHGDLDARIPSTTDVPTGLPVYSLYGEVKRPSDAMLQGMDALVFDVQDAGARFYTYITTLGYALEAATRRHLAFYVLDRPNPIGADEVQGPVLDPDLESFTGYYPLPVRHGMTVGELARLFNQENGIRARLTVIPMEGYRRPFWYDETGLQWVDPSPNLRSLAAATLYPGVALLEGANVSVGRGTATPFEVLGAPWLDGDALAAYLAQRRIAGVSFAAEAFTPGQDPYRDRPCQGVRLAVTDRRALDAPELGVEILSALWRIHPDRFALDRTLALVGSRRVLEAIRAGRDPRAIAQAWRAPLLRFGRVRERYLLY